MSAKKKLQVVCALIVNEEKILIARRKAGQSHAGYWEFPGGKIKTSEKPQDALKREILEEFNAVIEPVQSLPPVFHEYETHIVELMPYICSIQKCPLQPTVHDEILWIDKYFNMNLPILPPDLIIWNEYKKLILTTKT